MSKTAVSLKVKLQLKRETDQQTGTSNVVGVQTSCSEHIGSNVAQIA